MTPSLLEHINSGKTVEIDDLRFSIWMKEKGKRSYFSFPVF